MIGAGDGLHPDGRSSRTFAEFAGVEAYLASSLNDGTLVVVYGPDEVGLAAGIYHTAQSKAALLRNGKPIRADALVEGDGFTVTLVGTTPATLTTTYGPGYVDLKAEGSAADDEVVIDLDVFGDGGTLEAWLSAVGAAFLVDPSGTDSPVDDAMICIEMVNPATGKWVGMALKYEATGAQWDRYYYYDIGGGEVSALAFAGAAEDVSAIGWLVLRSQIRNAAAQSWVGNWSHTDGTMQGQETGVANITPFDPSDTTHKPRVRLRLRPKTGDLTIRLEALAVSERFESDLPT